MKFVAFQQLKFVNGFWCVLKKQQLKLILFLLNKFLGEELEVISTLLHQCERRHISIRSFIHPRQGEWSLEDENL